MIRVKICGVTRVEDAALAADLGAAAIGMVFARSPRQVSAAQAREICRELPPHVDRVGVFADQPAAEIRALAAEVGLTRIQLHGAEDVDLAANLAANLGGALTRALWDPAAWRPQIEQWCRARPIWTSCSTFPRRVPRCSCPTSGARPARSPGRCR